MRCPRCSSRRRCAPSCSSRCTRDGRAKIAPTTMIQILSAASGALVPRRMGRQVPCAGRNGHAAVPPHLGDGAPADLRVLVDRHRALRAAHGETTLRADYRRRHRGRSSGRPACRSEWPPLSGAPAMLLVLGAVQLLTVWLFSRFAASTPHAVERQHRDAAPSGPKTRSGLRVIAAAPHLRHLAALVLLGSTSAALLDYLFKARAVEAIGTGDQLLRFFALYYAAISLLTFTLQIVSSRTVLERFGLALTTSTPSIALLAGSIGGLVTPGFGSLVMARAGESIFRGSWFRAGYELFYTPIPAGGETRRQVDRRRQRRSARRCRWRRSRSAGRAVRSRLAIVCNPVDGDCELGRRDFRRKPAESLVRADAWHQPGAAGARSWSSRHRRTTDAPHAPQSAERETAVVGHAGRRGGRCAGPARGQPRALDSGAFEGGRA